MQNANHLKLQGALVAKVCHWCNWLKMVKMIMVMMRMRMMSNFWNVKVERGEAGRVDFSKEKWLPWQIRLGRLGKGLRTNFQTTKLDDYIIDKCVVTQRWYSGNLNDTTLFMQMTPTIKHSLHSDCFCLKIYNMLLYHLIYLGFLPITIRPTWSYDRLMNVSYRPGQRMAKGDKNRKGLTLRRLTFLKSETN